MFGKKKSADPVIPRRVASVRKGWAKVPPGTLTRQEVENERIRRAASRGRNAAAQVAEIRARRAGTEKRGGK